MGKAIDTDIIRVDASEPPYIPPQYPDRRCGDTDYWADYHDFVPGEGEFIVYSDYHQVEVEGVLVDVPGVKIGDGVSTVSELPFITAYEDAHLDDSSIFWATYGETTYGEIMQASSQEKKVCCKYNSNIYDLVFAGSYCIFACTDNIVSPAIVRFLRVETSDSWSSTDTGALATAAVVAEKENTSNKTQTINEYSSDIQYPSAQAVYNKIIPIDNKATGAREQANNAFALARTANERAGQGIDSAGEAMGRANAAYAFCETLQDGLNRKPDLVNPATDGDIVLTDANGGLYDAGTPVVFEKGSVTNSIQQKGTGAVASGVSSVAEGGDNLQGGTPASGEEKLYAKAEGYASHAEGAANAIGRYSHAEGGGNSIVQGKKTVPTAEGAYSHAEGSHTYAKGDKSHAEGSQTDAIGETSHAEGYDTKALGGFSHSEGAHTLAMGNESHAEGANATSKGEASHVEGFSSNKCSDPNGSDAQLITAWNANKFSIAKGLGAHAEGRNTLALSAATHAEGYETIAEGSYGSHAEGRLTHAKKNSSHAEGVWTETTNEAEHGEGKYNVSISGSTIHTVGIGTADNARKNAHTITTDGKHYIPGIGTYTGTETELPAGQDLATIVNAKAPLASPALTGAPTAPTAAAGTNTTQIATTAFVNTAIDNLPKPMQFKGSLGTGGTITSLPTASEANIGWTYQVITAGTYAGQTADVGDVFISTGAEWTLIPSGDEPTGTVTSVGAGTGLSISGNPAIDPTVNVASGYKLPTTTEWDGKASADDMVWEAGTGTSSVKQKGSNGVASGSYSVAAGYTNQTNGLRATNTGTFALGYNVKSGKQINASGVGAIAIGSVSDESYSDSILASRKYTVAIGNGSQATGDYSMAIGRLCVASAARSVAMGNEAHATGTNSFSLRGYADGAYSVSIGGRAVAERSITMGDGTRTTRNNSIAIGAYNRYDTNVQFAVGVGTADTARVNALEVCANKFYVKGLGTYDGTNPVSGTNDVGTIIDGKADLAGSSTQDFAAKDLTVSHIKYNGQTFNLNPTQGGQLALTTDIPLAQAQPQIVEDTTNKVRFFNGTIIMDKDAASTITYDLHDFFDYYCRSLGINPDDSTRYGNLGLKCFALTDFLYNSKIIKEHVPVQQQTAIYPYIRTLSTYSREVAVNVFSVYNLTITYKASDNTTSHLYLEVNGDSSGMQVRLTNS